MAKHALINRLKCVFYVVGSIYVANISVHLLINLIDSLCVDVDLEPYQNIKKETKNSWIYNLVLFLIIGPVIEELVFRKPIKNHSYYTVIPTILFVFSIVAYCFTYEFSFLLLLVYGIYLMALFFIYRSVLFSNRIVTINWIISSLIFGVLHLYNHNFHELNLDISGLLYVIEALSPLIIAGFGFGYIRIKLDTYWSVIAHSIYNFLPFVAITFF